MSDEENTFNLAVDLSGGTALNPYPAVCNPGTSMYVGDVPWQNVPPPPPWQQPVVIQPVYQPSFTFPTEADLRAFVEQCIAKYLDEKIDERVAKALDELAAEMRDKAMQPGTWRMEAGKE